MSTIFFACNDDEEIKNSSTTDPTSDWDTEDTSDTDTDTDTDTDITETGGPDETGEPPLTLFDELGGETGINAVLDAFLANVLADDEINWMFANADAAGLKQKLYDQICEATGGGCTYGGLDMATAHATMGITDAQFNAMVADLLAAFDTLGVEYTAGTFDGELPADTLIVVLAGMQGDIVTDAAGDQIYFNQLGGHAAVSAVVTDFLGKVAANTEINSFFATTDIADLNQKLVDQICSATGGFCVYSGQDMVTAHTGMCVSNSDFDSMVGNLLATFDDLGVPYTAGTFDGGVGADTLITVLAGMRTDIVEDPENDGCPPQ